MNDKLKEKNMQNKDCRNLRPCPFCGGKARIQELPPPIHYKYRAECGSSSCELFPFTNWKRKKQEAIEVWNRRVNDER